MLPLRRRRSTAVWLLTGQVARMPPLVGEGYGNRRDRPLVEFDGAKVAHAIRLRDGDVSAASALGSQKRRDRLGYACHIDIYDITIYTINC